VEARQPKRQCILQALSPSLRIAYCIFNIQHSHGGVQLHAQLVYHLIVARRASKIMAVMRLQFAATCAATTCSWTNCCRHGAVHV
jgi:hypothetical protein